LTSALAAYFSAPVSLSDLLVALGAGVLALVVLDFSKLKEPHQQFILHKQEKRLGHFLF